MKLLAAIYFLLFTSNFSFSQTELKVYLWSDAKSMSIDSVFAISFEKEKIDSLPYELFNFVNLKKLDLSKQKIKNLPKEFVNLKNLEHLDLSKNKLVLFPTQLCHLPLLKELILNRNYFESIPECIENLILLEKLDLWATPVGSFPEQITKLTKLKLLDVRGVKYSPKFQEKWKSKLSWVKIEFDSPCDCFD
jgi:Leucine-rich repeat (LRR) protein